MISIPRTVKLSLRTLPIVLVLIGANIAKAHPEENWYVGKWKPIEIHHTGLNIVWRFSPGLPDGNGGPAPKRERVKDGFKEWNDVNQDMHFDHQGDDDHSFTFECWEDNDYNGVFFNSIDGLHGTLGRTKFCDHDDSPYKTGHHFMVKFDEDDDGQFHYGDENGSDQYHDFEALATHEVGHATGGWLTYANGQSPSHFPSSYAACDGTLDFHTMCQGAGPGNTKWGVGKRTLEVHDSHTFGALYPP